MIPTCMGHFQTVLKVLPQKATKYVTLYLQSYLQIKVMRYRPALPQNKRNALPLQSNARYFCITFLILNEHILLFDVTGMYKRNISRSIMSIKNLNIITLSF